MSHGSAARAIVFALAANLGIAAIKTGAALWTGSGAMLAEAIHSFADCGNQVLLFVGIHQSRQPATALHPLGHGRAMYFWSMLVAVLLFTMGGIFSVYEGILRVLHPEPVQHALLAMGVLLASVVLEGFSTRAALLEIRRESPDQSLWQWFRHTRRSELLVVLCEDLAAILGLFIAFLAIAFAWLLDNPLYDALGSISVGIVLMAVAALVGREIKSLVIGESAAPEIHQAIATNLAARPEVAEILHLITLQWGEDLVVAVKARMVGMEGTAIDLVAAINHCEARIKAEFPTVRWIFFEPDVHK
jgi:cation diffusion facilitator family transporter